MPETIKEIVENLDEKTREKALEYYKEKELQDEE